MTIARIVRLLLAGYPVPVEMLDRRFPSLPQQVGGFQLTLLVTLVSLVFGAAIGLALALARRRPAGKARVNHPYWLRANAVGLVATAVVETVRGIPIMIIVLVTFHLPYRLASVRAPAFVLATLAFSLYAAVYISETVRAGLESIDADLLHAGRVLGLTRRQILWKIELPLVWRTMRPDFIGLAVTVFKDTSTLAIVAVPETTYVGRQMLMSEPVNYSLVLLAILFLYWAPASILSLYASRVERRQTRAAVVGGSWP